MYDSIWALVPVKPFRQAKRRLRAALSANQRATLARALMMHTLDVLVRCDVAGVAVVTADPMAVDLARGRAVDVVGESGDGLNAALCQAREHAAARGARATLVLPADLPLLLPGDVSGILAAAAGCEVAIAPSHDGSGTNALLTRPPDALHYAFGPNSFAEHVAQAETSGLHVRVYRARGFALDLDTPRDLAAWLSIDAGHDSQYDRLARGIAALRDLPR